MLLVLGKCWKTLTSTVTGIAQQENLITSMQSFTIYWNGWTSLPIAKENLITNKHLLNMTLDDSTDDVTRLTSPTKPMEHAGPITCICKITRCSGTS
jgi:hypothetical protein